MSELDDQLEDARMDVSYPTEEEIQESARRIQEDLNL